MGRLSYQHNDIERAGKDAGDYSTNVVANTTGDRLVATLNYQMNPAWTFGWNAQFVKGEDNVDLSEAVRLPEATTIDKPGYAAHDFYAQWHTSTIEDVTITLTVGNVFDKYDLEHATVADMADINDGFRGFAEPG